VADERDDGLAAPDLPEIVRKIRARTPARLLVGRAGASYRTSTQMELLEAHAGARDAVRTELDLAQLFDDALVKKWKLFETRTKALTKDEYLLRPDLGRRFDDESRAKIQDRCPRDSDIQIAIGDGLSVSAVAAQGPTLLPLLLEGAQASGWKIGVPFAIRHSRVGILNEISELLDPRVAVVLIGERPGLATAESLSAYMAYRPRESHTDADRNLVSNIHARGLSPQDAAERILTFVAQMMKEQRSGCVLGAPLQTLESQ